eukprot:scaffold2031_cov185-Alexandrium_tamarense.AAC.17
MKAALVSSLSALAFLLGTNITLAFTSPTSQFQRVQSRGDNNVVHQPTSASRAPPSSSALITSITLSSSTTNDNIDPYTSPELDTSAITKYVIAAITELSLFGLTFQTLDFLLSKLDVTTSSVPFPLIAFLFYASSLKSRVFNPLNNQRPDRSKAMKEGGSNGFRDRVMPSWTPPGVVFPIMWVLIIGPIRAYSSALVVSSTGSFFSVATMAFMLHLTCGDIWNTINNTEKRYGAAVVGIIGVVLSAANAANQYYQVDPLAGKLLGGTLLWLVTAGALITDTWRLNPVEGTGERVPLYPVKGEAETKFMWFSSDVDASAGN